MRARTAMRCGLLVGLGLLLGPASRAMAQKITKVNSRFGKTQVMIPDPLFSVTISGSGMVIASTFVIRVDHTDDDAPCHRVFSVTSRFADDVRRGVVSLVPSAGNRTGPCGFDFGDVHYPDFLLSYPAPVVATNGAGGTSALPGMGSPYFDAEREIFTRYCASHPGVRGKQIVPYHPLSIGLSYLDPARPTMPAGPPDLVVNQWNTNVELTCAPSAADGGGGSSPVTGRDRTPPQLLSFVVAPDTLPFAGGNVTITVKASDNESVASVTALYLRPDGTQSGIRVPMTGGAAANGEWKTAWSVPMNADARPKVYVVKVTVVDGGGNAVTSPAKSISVAPKGSAPTMPKRPGIP